MSAVLHRADLPAVTSGGGDDDRGAAIRARLEVLGISDREWYKVTGMDRKTLNRAMRNEPGTRSSTYDAIEANLDKLERHAQGQPVARAVGNPSDDLVEFSVEGNFGVRAVVKGPVRDIEALREAVAKLIADMNRDAPNG